MGDVILHLSVVLPTAANTNSDLLTSIQLLSVTFVTFTYYFMTITYLMFNDIL